MVRMFTNPPQGIGKETFRTVVQAAYMAYQLQRKSDKKTLPSVEDIRDYCPSIPKPKIAKIVASEEFLIALRERGVYWSAKDGLTPEQSYAIGIMTNPADKRDMAGKLKAAGITMTTYRSWLKTPLFARAIKQIGEDMLHEHMADVNTSILKNAIDGNMKAVEIYNQLTGRFDPQQQSIQDLNRLINLLLEIIFRHVTNTDTLRNIQAEFDLVMSGKVPQAELYVEGELVPELTELTQEQRSGAVVENFQEPVNAREEADLDDSIPPGFFDYQEEVPSFNINKDN